MPSLHELELLHSILLILHSHTLDVSFEIFNVKVGLIVVPCYSIFDLCQMETRGRKRRAAEALQCSSVCERHENLFIQHRISTAQEIKFDLTKRLQTGPTSYTDRFTWETFGWTQLTAPAKDRLIRNMKLLEPASHCTGICGQENLLFHITREVNKHLHEPIEYKRSTHTSEISDSRLQMLMTLPEEVRPLHIHMAIRQRYPEYIQNVIDKLTPKPGTPVDVKMERFDLMKHELRQFYYSLESKDYRAPCLCHPNANEGCKLFSNGEDDLVSDDSRDVFTLLGAGIPCQDDSLFNNTKEGRTGKQRPTHLMIQEEMTYLNPVLSVIECADGLEPDELAYDNEDTHTTQFCRLQSSKFGDSYHRDRSVAWLYDKERVLSSV